ncbi:MAG: type 1 glutamine amidotransferase domain-containing protein [Flavobacteriales bacterium]|jgi:putative intracellular protease/amidase
MITESQQYVHFHGAPSKGKILMVASSPAVSGQTGWPVGFWASELTHALRVFKEAGFDIELVSTEGGEIRMDAYSDPTDASGYSAHDVITLGYLQQDWFREMLRNTRSVAQVSAADYDAIYLLGGQAPMYTFRGNTTLENLFASFYAAGKPSAAVCHATTLLLGVRLPGGELLVHGKTWTGFADAEEDFVEQAMGMKIQPYRIETEARKLEGTAFRVAPPFVAYAIADGNLITGQQQNSGEAAARLLTDQLNARVAH